MKTRLSFGLVAIGMFVASGCSSPNAGQNAASPSPTMKLEAQPMSGAAPKRGAVANGRAIFQTGKDLDGIQISARQKPLHPNCAACHGADGAGGKKLPGGATSADLRHKAIVTNEKVPYTQALLERAISTGIDNDGKPLNAAMPRWTLSKRDLHDVAWYVLTQLK